MMIGKWNRRRLATTLACSVALPLAYAGSAHAAVVTKTIAGFQVVAQEQGNWCSLGAAQMILKYYGANVAQCEMANYDFGRTDCCTYPSSAACNPSTGAFTGTP